MKYAFFSKALPAFTLAAVALASLPAGASPYTSMVVFGDSLSDSGNAAFFEGSTVQTITGNTYVPSHPYTTPTSSGTFSNGPVWASDVASALGVPLLPSTSGGTNFAFGGATTGGPGPSPNLILQAGQYLSSTGGLASPNALYVVEGGGNDARAALPAIIGGTATIGSTANAYVANIDTIVHELQAAGAQHIIVWDTPNLGLTPASVASGVSSLGTALAAGMNALLTTNLAGDTGVSIFDIYGLGTSIAANPGLFNLVNVTDACGAPSNACDPTTAEYWDGIHPTAAAHMLIADAFLAEAVPEPSIWAMLILGFAGIGFMAYRRKSKPVLMAA